MEEFEGIEETYVTRGGVRVQRRTTPLAPGGATAAAIEGLVDALDERRGVLLASSYEVPGRYTRWDVGFVDPPLVITTRGRRFEISALNARGRVLLPACARAVAPAHDVVECDSDAVAGCIVGQVAAPGVDFAEEERTRQPSVFSVLRALQAAFFHPDEPHLGLHGAFGYDLAFQLDPVRLRLPRPARQRDLVLYLPDSIVVVDHRRERAARHDYDFHVAGVGSTAGLPREGARRALPAAAPVPYASDHAPGEYAAVVRDALGAFARGDLFEAVPGQTFFEPASVAPSELFRRLRERNPAPYGFLVALGKGEHLVGASPEMYVRVSGRRVETCPIAGTIARGADPLADAAQVQRLLDSAKDEAELTMCTDVDRNDKSRVCEPGSVRVLGRRQVELYSRLIHTVDHVEGTLRAGMDALDAFLTHAWAVTITGAPKLHAMQFVEDHERSPRAWYGGAVGKLGFDGNLNTGLTLRTIRLVDGVAEVRAGATLLHDSDPDAEERETQLKASALLDALRRPRAADADADAAADADADAATDAAADADAATAAAAAPRRLRILLVDHQDSFVHTLAAYFRCASVPTEVTTRRSGFAPALLDQLRPDLVVLSPGPGAPRDFDLSGTLAALVARDLPVFGVCLGLQGIVEYFGGELGVLPVPRHGKPSRVRVLGAGGVLAGLPSGFVAGRYHSLHARRERLPAELRVTAESEDDGIVMAIEHVSRPIAAVQFHPESIMTLHDGSGMRLIENVLAVLGRG
jgi:anthranilate synthase